jgi:hypothetical protein
MDLDLVACRSDRGRMESFASVNHEPFGGRDFLDPRDPELLLDSTGLGFSAGDRS